MVFVIRSTCLYAVLVACVGMSGVRGSGGWLDRAISYQRRQFENDVKSLAPVQLEASIEPAPPGYKDSERWDGAAVTRLLALLSASDPSTGARRALARLLPPHTRRFFSKKQSWKLFPSLGKEHGNDLYYDLSSSGSSEEMMPALPAQDDDVLVLRNPVEARLPSARISVKLLREILEARAVLARQMPPTPRPIIPWIPMNKSTTPTAVTDDVIVTTINTNDVTSDVANEVNNDVTEDGTNDVTNDVAEEVADDDMATQDGDVDTEVTTDTTEAQRRLRLMKTEIRKTLGGVKGPGAISQRGGSKKQATFLGKGGGIPKGKGRKVTGEVGGGSKGKGDKKVKGRMRNGGKKSKGITAGRPVGPKIRNAKG